MEWFYDGIQDKASELEKYSGFHLVRMAINLHIGMIFLKEKELYEKTMDEIYAKRYI